MVFSNNVRLCIPCDGLIPKPKMLEFELLSFDSDLWIGPGWVSTLEKELRLRMKWVRKSFDVIVSGR
jgi:hypothetical protein